MEYGTLQYEIKDALELIMRIDQQFKLLSKLMYDRESKFNIEHMVNLTKMLAYKAKSLYPDIYPDKEGTYSEPVYSFAPRLIKH